MNVSRRSFLAAGLAALPAMAGLPRALGAETAVRRLDLHHLHTGEHLDLEYFLGGAYQPEALVEVNRFLRDFRTGDEHVIDPGLLDLLHQLRAATGSTRPFEVISGYRSPRTNALLRARSDGVAASSLHMRGMAIDIQLPGVPLRRLRDGALSLRRGGVGYYPASDFVHVDTGRVRRW